MSIRWLQGLSALLLGAMVVALPAAAIASHSHPEGADQSCALCHTVHLPGFLTVVPGMSRPGGAYTIQSATPVFRSEGFSPAPSSRGPPVDTRPS